MNKPTVLAILNAVEKIYLPILQNKFGKEEGKALNSNSLARLLCELKPLIIAHAESELRRQIVIAGLSGAITVAIHAACLEAESCYRYGIEKDTVPTFIQPWMDRLRS